MSTSFLNGSHHPLTDEEKEVFQKILSMCLEYMDKNYDVNEPIVRFKKPEELKQEINLEIGQEGTGLKGILKDLEATLKYSVRTGHVRFFNQLWAGTDIAAVIGEWLTAVMNTSMYTYEVSPVFTMMELYILKKIRKFIGWEKGDGVFAPGGANCNLLGLLAARNYHYPNIKKDGISSSGKELVLFTSEQSHYTIQRGASVVGVGMNGCRKVPADKFGKMIPSELERLILEAKAEGKSPFFVNATCGSTVLGAYDDLNAIADICERHNIWLHIDACWGGHCLLSDKHRNLMSGCERAHSIAWTGTKCLGLPQQCALLVMREEKVLVNCNAMHEDYLFHEHEEMDYDLGEKTLNCGRRVDALKLWVAWKVYGQKGFEERVNHAFDQAQYISSEIKKRAHSFRLLVEPESLNVCFWFIPPSARNLPEGEEKDKKLDHACLTVRRRIQLEGKLLLNYSDLKGVHGHFFRLITCNPGAGHIDMDFILNEIERLGADL